MEIVERELTEHAIINIHYQIRSGEVHEKWVDVHKNKDGEVLAVNIGSKEITAFELRILDFLQRKEVI